MFKKQQLVSIIIPVYNGSNYLHEAIESVLNQTYKNIEIIVVNDGSTDQGKTETIAKRYGNRLRYFTKRNGGVSSALNFGIKKMKGDWFAWLSHDDYFSSDRIETDIDILQSDKLITFCGEVKVNDKGRVLKPIKKQAEIVPKVVAGPRDVLALKGLHMCTMTISKKCFQEVGTLFDENNPSTQDVQMTLALSKKYPFFHNKAGKTFVRDHPYRGTVTRVNEVKVGKQYLCDYVASNFKIEEFFPDYLKMSKRDKGEAWSWLGDFYMSQNCFKHADSCYIKGYNQTGLLSRVGIKRIVGAKRISKLLNMRHTFNSHK